MTKFTNVIVRRPAKSMVEGITSAPELGKPDYELALQAARRLHRGPQGLRRGGDGAACARAVPRLLLRGGPGRRHAQAAPSSPTPARPAATARRTRSSPPCASSSTMSRVEAHREPRHARRRRRDDGGRPLLRGALRAHERGGHPPVLRDPGGLGPRRAPRCRCEHVLHLKTGVNYLEDGNMLVSGEFVDQARLRAVQHASRSPRTRPTPPTASGSTAPCIVPEGYPTVLEKAVQDAGYETITVDTSEYRKLDGGLSCLSLALLASAPKEAAQ